MYYLNANHNMIFKDTGKTCRPLVVYMNEGNGPTHFKHNGKSFRCYWSEDSSISPNMLPTKFEDVETLISFLEVNSDKKDNSLLIRALIRLEV